MVGRCPAAVTRAIERLRGDFAAARFHLQADTSRRVLTAILGGTGTGKSTLINRLLGADLTATSFRRTFTAGAVAVVREPADLPPGWSGLELVTVPPNELPARGRPDVLTVVPHPHPLLERVVLIDTPDLDGDQPAHHAQADRIFRWADAVLFLVSPEKYQMPELMPYYRLAGRYEMPALFVMNKVEEPAVVEDYAARLASAGGATATGAGATRAGATCAGDAPAPYALPRDDAAYEPPPPMNLEALRSAIGSVSLPLTEAREPGLRNRLTDLLGRLQDQVLAPSREARRQVDRLTASLRAMEAPEPPVDASPLLLQLQRRMQQRSVLYLIGPGKVLERVRQVPSLLVRLPRHAWDLLRHGELSRDGAGEAPADVNQQALDFQSALADQMKILQSRIDDVLRGSDLAAARMDEPGGAYARSKVPPQQAAAIAEEELAALRQWMETRWNATPRDTAVIEKLVKFLPGGRKLTKWSEAAPYVLAAVVATHHAFFGPIDLLVLGGYGLATWITERLSNEVATQAKATNRRIAERFGQLAHRQIDQTIQWLQSLAPEAGTIDRIEELAEQTAAAMT